MRRAKTVNIEQVLFIDLDVRQTRQDERPKPSEELEEVQIGETFEKTTKINAELPRDLKEELISFLKWNSDLFVFMASNMPIIDPNFMCHQLAVNTSYGTKEEENVLRQSIGHARLSEKLVESWLHQGDSIPDLVA